jgi:hypothetical protein
LENRTKAHLVCREVTLAEIANRISCPKAVVPVEARQNDWTLSGTKERSGDDEKALPQETKRVARKLRLETCAEVEVSKKISKSADELRAIVVEAISHPVCSRDIDVVIRPDAARGWAADVVSTNRIGNADCVHWIGTIVQRLRREYDLEDLEQQPFGRHFS